MSEHIHFQFPDGAPLYHPLVVMGFIGLNIFLNSVPVENLGYIAHGVVYTAQVIAAFMAAMASYYAIRHYRSIYQNPKQ